MLKELDNQIKESLIKEGSQFSEFSPAGKKLEFSNVLDELKMEIDQEENAFLMEEPFVPSNSTKQNLRKEQEDSVKV